MTLTDQFNAFCKASKGKLGAAERGLYITLLDIWNRLRRPEWFDVSNTELQNILATGSHNSITRWRKALEQAQFIEAKTMGRGKPLRFHITELATTSENDVPTSKSDVPTTAKTAVPTSKSDVPNKATTSENDVLPRQKVTSSRSENDVGVRQKMTTSQSTEIYTEITESLSKVGTTLEVHTPPERETPPLPDDLLIYYHRFNPTPKQTEKDKLAIWAEQYTKTAVMDAIDIAIENEAHNIKYIGKVLENSKGDIHGPRHKAYGGGYQTTIDPQAERDKWRHETSGWD